MSKNKICKSCGESFTMSYIPTICLNCDWYFECSHGHSLCTNH